MELFTNMGGLMAERVTDLRDIERRVVANLVGEPEPGVPTPDEPSVLVAEDLAPSDTAVLDPGLVIGLVTERGGPTSHTAIIARQLGLPCVVGAGGAMEIPAGSPGAARRHHRAGGDRARRGRDRAPGRPRPRGPGALDAWTGPGATADGTPVKLLANVADASSATTAASGPVGGVGLLRTELSFLNRQDEPSVEEQADIYAGSSSPSARASTSWSAPSMPGRTSRSRSRPIEGEENPALGVRGLRLSFDNPGLLERQLDAIALAAERTGVETWVMAPMVATVAEAEDFAGKVRDRGLKAGVMVEVPSAALLADRMLEVVDFLSIGTNDLSQYTMAADRMATELAHLTDAWQPAVLTLIQMTAEAGLRAGKPVGVCGEAAADPMLATVLIGMGITSLSMASARSARSAPASPPRRWRPARPRPRPRWPHPTRWPRAPPYATCWRPEPASGEDPVGERAVGPHRRDQRAAELGEPLRPGCAEDVPRGVAVLVGPRLHLLPQLPAGVGEGLLGGHQPAVDQGGPAAAHSSSDQPRVACAAVLVKPRPVAVCETATRARTGPRPARRDVPVAAVLAEQGQGVEQHEVGLLGPGQVGVPGVQRPAGDGAPLGGGAGELGGLRDLGGGQRSSPSSRSHAAETPR